jgi:hypothetical protein
VPFYNQEFAKTLSDARLNVDYEAHLAWEAGGSAKGRPPRRLTVALCGDVPNVWAGDGLMPYSRIITLPCPKSAEDYLKVQNVLSLREMDVADINNLSVPDRNAMLGAAAFKSLFLKAKAALPTAAEINKDLQMTAGRGKRRRLAKRDESDDEEEKPDVKGEILGGGAASSPGVAGRQGSAPGPGTGAAANPTPPQASSSRTGGRSVGGTNMPMLVVALGVGNGNIAVAAVETVVASPA